MRPPQITGGNRWPPLNRRRTHSYFNEAPADHGGEPAVIEYDEAGNGHFNEAPADHGGEPTR